MNSVIESVLYELGIIPRTAIIVDADKLLISIRHTDHHDAFEVMLSDENNLTFQNIVTEAERMVGDQLDEILSEHGILLIDMTPLQYKVKYVSALYSLADIDEIEPLKALVEMSDTPADLFMGLMEWLLGTDEMEVGQWIHDVNEIFSRRLISFHMAKENLDVGEVREPVCCLRINKYLALDCSPLFKAALDHGLRLDQSIAYYKLALEEDLVAGELTPQKTTDEILAWVLASDVVDADVAATVMHILEKDIDMEPIHISKMSMRVNDRLLEYVSNSPGE